MDFARHGPHYRQNQDQDQDQAQECQGQLQLQYRPSKLHRFAAKSRWTFLFLLLLHWVLRSLPTPAPGALRKRKTKKKGYKIISPAPAMPSVKRPGRSLRTQYFFIKTVNNYHWSRRTTATATAAAAPNNAAAIASRLQTRRSDNAVGGPDSPSLVPLCNGRTKRHHSASAHRRQNLKQSSSLRLRLCILRTQMIDYVVLMKKKSRKRLSLESPSCRPGTDASYIFFTLKI